MNPPSQSNDPQEIYIQEPVPKTLTDTSLPAGQVIAEQSKDTEEYLAPRFIP